MLLWKAVKGEASFQVTLQAFHSRRISLLIFLDECCHGLICLLPIVLIKESSQFGLDLILLLVGNVTEDIVHLMHDTALTSRGRKVLRDRIEHGLVAITDPQRNLFDPSSFQIV